MDINHKQKYIVIKNTSEYDVIKNKFLDYRSQERTKYFLKILNDTNPGIVLINKTSSGEITVYRDVMIDFMIHTDMNFASFVAKSIDRNKVIEFCKYISHSSPKYNDDERGEVIHEYISHMKEIPKLNIKCGCEIIDILTDTTIIQIDYCINWKSVVIKILAFSSYFPNHKKIIHLFDHENNDITKIIEVCKTYNIILSLLK